MIETIALIASVCLPLTNIPMIIKMVKRRSSKDISMIWAVGVWVCLAAMLPSGLRSPNVVWKTFCIANIILFSGVTVSALYYRKGEN